MILMGFELVLPVVFVLWQAKIARPVRASHLARLR